MTQVLKLTGIIIIIVGVILTILQLVTLIQADDSLAFGHMGIIIGVMLIEHVFYGVVCLGLAKMIELLENR